MVRVFRHVVILCGFLLVSAVKVNAETFKVDDIRVECAKKISSSTVFNYLPIKVGDSVDVTIIRDAVRALFRTGFFRDVEIRREGGVVVISVQERPAIASIEYSGNKELKDEEVDEILKRLSLIHI